MLKKQAGFNLTELLVTMAIMGTLIGVAVPMYQGMNSKGAARVHQKNFSDAVSFVAAECQKAGLNPGALANIYVELNGGATGSETVFAPGSNNPAFTFGAGAAGVGAGQVDISGLTAPTYQCTAGTSPVVITSGTVANGAAATDYASGDPDGFARTIQ